MRVRFFTTLVVDIVLSAAIRAALAAGLGGAHTVGVVDFRVDPRLARPDRRPSHVDTASTHYFGLNY